MNGNEVYSEGSLIYTRIKVWPAMSKLGKDSISNKYSDEEKNLIKSENKIILDETVLDDIASVRDKVWNEIHIRSLPFPVNSLQFVRSSKINELNDIVFKQKKIYWKLVDQFIMELFVFDGIVASFKKKYPTLHAEAVKTGAYPRDELATRRKFGFRYSWCELAVPESNSEFTKEMIKDARESRIMEIEEMKVATMVIVRDTLLERVAALSKQCVNGKVNSKTLTAWDKWLDNFDSLWGDFVWRDDLKDVVSTVRKSMKKVSLNKLKGDDGFREKLGKKLEKVSKSLELLPDIKSKRSFDL